MIRLLFYQGNDRKEENSRGKIWFGGNETFSTARPQSIQQPLPTQISQSVPPTSTASIPPPNLSFINFLRKEPEITSVEELEAKMRLAEVNERQKKPQPDSDAFRKLLEQLGPGNQQQPQLMHQPHQMHFGGGPQVPGDFYINRQDILKTPEAQVLVQSKCYCCIF